jgi:hypothetical protein
MNPLATEATRSKSELLLAAFPLVFPNQTGHGGKESRTSWVRNQEFDISKSWERRKAVINKLLARVSGPTNPVFFLYGQRGSDPRSQKRLSSRQLPTNNFFRPSRIAPHTPRTRTPIDFPRVVRQLPDSFPSS